MSEERGDKQYLVHTVWHGGNPRNNWYLIRANYKAEAMKKLYLFLDKHHIANRHSYFFELCYCLDITDGWPCGEGGFQLDWCGDYSLGDIVVAIYNVDDEKVKKLLEQQGPGFTQTNEYDEYNCPDIPENHYETEIEFLLDLYNIDGLKKIISKLDKIFKGEKKNA